MSRVDACHWSNKPPAISVLRTPRARPCRERREALWHLGNGWTCKTFGLTPSLEIVAFLSKAEVPLIPRRNILGLDINAKNFAYTILTPEGQVLKQGYLGQQIWVRKRHFEERRGCLQSLNALEKLKLMRHRQRNYVKTNIGHLVREIILLAKKYEADVSIERLRRFKPKGRTFNRKVMTIPFHLFKRILEARCFDNGIMLNRVDPYHTSKWCSRCGAVGAGHDCRTTLVQVQQLRPGREC